MNGKDLFEAMSHVDDELVTEAEEKTLKDASRSYRKKYWGTLAACFCVLVISAAAITVYHTQGGINSEKSAAPVLDESADVAAPMEPEESVPNANNAGGTSEGVAETESVGAKTQGLSEDDAKYADLAEGGSLTETPMPGEYVYFPAVSKAMESYEGQDVYFLLAFDLFDEAGSVARDSAEYQRECERLVQCGYEMHEIAYWTYDEKGENQELTAVVGVYSTEELHDFQASSDYGYAFYFITNGDGSAISWAQENVVVNY